MKSFSSLNQSEFLQTVNIPFASFQESFVHCDELDSTTNESECTEFCDVKPNNTFLHPPKDLVVPSFNEFTSCQEIDLKKDFSARECMHPSPEGSSKKQKKSSRPRKCLGKDFKPSKWDVICGRGKLAYEHIGNRRFKLIIAMNLPSYVEANFQADKAHIVDTVVKQIREAASPNPGFVKQDANGNWYDVGMAMARVKVSRTFRDSMTGTLRQSTRLSREGKSKNVREAQNAIARSCQIEFSSEN